MKSISKEEFLERFKKKFPEEDIEILEYSAVSRPIKIKCRWCGKVHYYGTGDQLLASFKCCQAERHKLQEQVNEIYKNKEDFELIRWADQTHVIIQHKKCGHQINKSIKACLTNPYSCKYCEMAELYSPQTQEEAAAQLKEKFHDFISLLEFNKEGKSKYKCNKCGAEFSVSHPALMLSHGCPKCRK